ncbi:MAG TPA: amino acid permease [Kofleriaceae bacterium]|nr:amino acid permease [Kofleriaceae bacterium]
MTAKRLGVIAATAIVVANMIGTGVFTSTGFQAIGLHDAGTILVVWVVGGVLALCGAACYAELGAMMPRVGGEYVYLREGLHPLVGVMSGWASVLAGFSAPIAVSSMAFAKYTAAIWPSLADPTSQQLLAIGLIVAMTVLHSFSTVLGGRVQTVFTAAKTLLIVTFILAGFTAGGGSTAHFASQAGGLSNIWTAAFGISLMYVSFAYSGWNAAAYIAGEIDRPEKSVPRALLYGTGLVMLLYVLLNVLFIYALPIDTLAHGDGGGPIVEVGDASARALFGPRAGQMLSTLIALALVSSVSAMVMAGPRVYAAMAEDGALPKTLARRSHGGAPAWSVVVQGALAIAITMTGRFDQIVRYVGFTLTIFAALTCIAMLVMRRTRPDMPRPFKTFGYPITPLVFIAGSIWIAYSQIELYPTESLYGVGTLVFGVVAYFVSRSRR